LFAVSVCERLNVPATWSKNGASVLASNIQRGDAQLVIVAER
jgi:hypothetical protein